MRPIGEKNLEQLQERGLLTNGPFPPERSLAHGVWVLKPATTKGNSVPDYELGYGLEPRILCDAPSVMLIPEGDKWVVWLQEHIPTMEPGDFKNYWSTEQEAVDDVLDFFFGDPKRMKAV